MIRQFRLTFVLPTTLALMIPFCTLDAQRTTSRIVGTVTDASGAVAAQVKVTAVDELTNLRYAATSDDQGFYAFPTLEPGKYSVTVAQPGFKTLTLNGIVLEVDRDVTINLKMEVGLITQSVAVQADAPVVDSESAVQSNAVDRQQMNDLPINSSGGRDMMDFLLLGAGVTSSGNPYGNANYTVLGSNQNTQTVVVDGQNIFMPGGSFYQVRPAVDELTDVKTQSGTFSGENMGLSVITMYTISGSNQFHGSFSYFFSNQNFVARTFFQPYVPPFHFEEYAGTVAGPIIKNRTFFAFSYDREDRSNPQAAINTVPVDQLRNGNFAGLGLGTIYDPNTLAANPTGSGKIRTPFPNNQIPASRISSTAVKMMTYLPEPNIPGGALTNNWNPQLLGVATNNDAFIPNLSFKLDQKITDKNHFFIRYQREWGGYRAEEVFPGPADYTGQTVASPANTINLGDTYTVTPTIINEFHGSWLKFLTQETNISTNTNQASLLGLQGASPLLFPVVSITGTIPIRFGPRDNNGYTNDQIWQFTDNLTIVRGRQIIKFGGSFNRDYLNTWSSGSPSGNFTFSGTFTNNPQVSSAGNGFADFLLGIPSSTTVSGSNLHYVYSRPAMGMFFQDDIKWRSNLTFNIGARYDLQWGPVEANNQMAQYSPTVINPATGTPGALVFAGTTAPRAFFPTIKNAISPRIGIAYALNPKTVFRAGWTINYWLLPITSEEGATTGTTPTITVTSADGYTPPVQLPGVLPVPLVPNRTATISNNQGVSYILPNTPINALVMLTFNIQRDLGKRWLVDLGYANTRGYHLNWSRDINQVPVALLGPGNLQSLRPIPQYTGLTYQYYDGTSKYNAMLLKVSRRMSRQISVMANYTYSRNLNYGTSYQDLQDLKAEWSLSPLNRSHVANLTAIYTTPQLGDNFVGKYLAKGWEVSSVLHAESGNPLNMVTSSNPSGALSGTERPNCIGQANLANPTVQEAFNLAAFAIPANYTFGSCGKDTFIGPNFVQLDVNFMKNVFLRTKLNETTRLEFRGELFNALNHPNFSNPNTTIGNVSAGTITGQNGNSRAVTLAAILRF